MGLHSELTDISAKTIPIILILTFFNWVAYLQSAILNFFRSLGLFRFGSRQTGGDVFDRAIGAGYAGVVMLAEQFNLNLGLCYSYEGENDGGCGCGSGRDCVVCLNRFSNGDRVRKLTCGHVFHNNCLDGWLDHFNFNCPLCRMSLLSDADDALAWFSWR